MQRDINLKLILLVQKNPCLYDTAMPEYSRKDITDKTWNEIGGKIGLTVAECKDKWRNMRCAFVRSLRQSVNSLSAKGSRLYYLHDYMQFLLPFVKTITVVESLDENLVSEADIKPESPNSSAVDSDDEAPSQNITEVSIDNIVSAGRKRKCMPEFIDYVETKMITRNDDSRRHFMLGLLPELNAMNDSQMREFKVKVILLIDEILSR